MTRTLTPLERALLRAVVELGDNAHGYNVDLAMVKSYGQWVPLSGIYDALKNLAHKGYIQSRDVIGNDGRTRRYWRPVVDLTTVLAQEEGTGT